MKIWMSSGMMEDDDVEIVEIDLSDQDDEDK